MQDASLRSQECLGASNLRKRLGSHQGSSGVDAQGEVEHTDTKRRGKLPHMCSLTAAPYCMEDSRADTAGTPSRTSLLRHQAKTNKEPSSSGVAGSQATMPMDNHEKLTSAAADNSTSSRPKRSSSPALAHGAVDAELPPWRGRLSNLGPRINPAGSASMGTDSTTTSNAISTELPSAPAPADALIGECSAYAGADVGHNTAMQGTLAGAPHWYGNPSAQMVARYQTQAAGVRPASRFIEDCGRTQPGSSQSANARGRQEVVHVRELWPNPQARVQAHPAVLTRPASPPRSPSPPTAAEQLSRQKSLAQPAHPGRQAPLPACRASVLRRSVDVGAPGSPFVGPLPPPHAVVWQQLNAVPGEAAPPGLFWNQPYWHDWQPPPQEPHWRLGARQPPQGGAVNGDGTYPLSCGAAQREGCAAAWRLSGGAAAAAGSLYNAGSVWQRGVTPPLGNTPNTTDNQAAAFPEVALSMMFRTFLHDEGDDGGADIAAITDLEGGDSWVVSTIVDAEDVERMRKWLLTELR